MSNSKEKRIAFESIGQWQNKVFYNLSTNTLLVEKKIHFNSYIFSVWFYENEWIMTFPEFSFEIQDRGEGYYHISGQHLSEDFIKHWRSIGLFTSASYLGEDEHLGFMPFINYLVKFDKTVNIGLGDIPKCLHKYFITSVKLI